MNMKNAFFMQKVMFLTLLSFSILVSLSSNSVLGIWMGIEINLISVISIFSMSSKSSQGILIYFLIQSISSVILLFSLICLMIYPFLKELIMNLIFLSIMTKMGFFPFHFWIPFVMETFSWLNCFILSTIQKIVPIMFLFLISLKKPYIVMCLINSTFAFILSFNQFSMRKIMSFSSMNHLSFLILSIFLTKKMFKIYYLFYIFLTFLTFFMFEKMKLNFLHQMFSIMKESNLKFVTIMFCIFSMAGIPPFPGFFPKMMIILKMLETNIILLSFLFLILSSLMTYMYLRFLFTGLLISKSNIKLYKKFNLKKSYLYIFFMIMMFFPIPLIL